MREGIVNLFVERCYYVEYNICCNPAEYQLHALSSPWVPVPNVEPEIVWFWLRLPSYSVRSDRLYL
jgi:hypothetical protein